MIGVFDSGLGGLTVLKEFLKLLPDYDYVYLGDNARMPYGDRNEKEIYRFTKKAIDFLFKRGCRLIIVACNTASAKALRKIQRNFLPKNHPGKNVLGVIIPTIEELADNQYKRVGLIGTRSTVKSKKYLVELTKVDKKIRLYQQACPLLVPMVENGEIESMRSKKILERYLGPLKKKDIEALVLGCTHYPLLEKNIQAILGSKIKVINPPVIIAGKLRDYISKHKELRLNKHKKRIFYTTGNPDKFKKLGSAFLGSPIRKVEKIRL